MSWIRPAIRGVESKRHGIGRGDLHGEKPLCEQCPVAAECMFLANGVLDWGNGARVPVNGSEVPTGRCAGWC